MVKCSKCGIEAGNSNFCPKCGQKVSGTNFCPNYGVNLSKTKSNKNKKSANKNIQDDNKSNEERFSSGFANSLNKNKFIDKSFELTVPAVKKL